MELQKLKKKSNALIALIFVLLLIGCKKVMIQNYYIPKDFVGNIAVIYNNSSDKNTDQSVFNYDIPESGILKTNYSFREGNYRINYYQKNNLNGYDTIFEQLPYKKLDSTKNRVYFKRILTFKKGGEKEVFVGVFYIGKEKSENLDKDRFLFEKKLEKIVLNNE